MLKKRILLIGNYEAEAMYHPLNGVEEKLRDILQESAELTCTDQTKELLCLEKYDGVISYLDIWDSVLTIEEAEALESFVKGGGMLLAIHNGISVQGRENLMRMIGAKFLTHPAQEEITFFPAKERHPITEGVGAFTLMEEPYQFAFADVPYTLFFQYRYQGKEYPAGWCREEGKGRVVYLTPGHTAEKFDHPEFQKLIQNSLRWGLFWE